MIFNDSVSNDDAQEQEKRCPLLKGVKTLDGIYDVLTQTRLTVIAADFCCGLREFALGMAVNKALDHGVPTMVLTVESSHVDAMRQILASGCGVDYRSILFQFTTPEEEVELQDYQNKIYSAPLYLLDGAEVTLEDVQSQIRKMVVEHEVKVVVIDDLQMMWHKGDFVGNCSKATVMIARRLKMLAEELDINIVVTTNLIDPLYGRSGTRALIPHVGHVPGSTALMAVADAMVFLYRLEVYDVYFDNVGKDLRGLAELRVDKLCGSCCEHFYLGYNEDTVKFFDIKDEEDETMDQPF